jgi:hypothetical protein
MRYSKFAVGLVCILTAVCVYAGGDPDYVAFPEGYDTSFTNYVIQNRTNGKQVARIFANDVAISSYKAGKTAASGAILVMEVYKPKTDDEGNPVVGEDGIFEIDKLAAIAVAERRDNWDAAYPAENRAGNWGFALYGTDGQPKANDLQCFVCHIPLAHQDFIFSHAHIVEHARSQ